MVIVLGLGSGDCVSDLEWEDVVRMGLSVFGVCTMPLLMLSHEPGLIPWRCCRIRMLHINLV